MQEQENGSAKTYIIKTYYGVSKEFYDKEVTAFRKLQFSPGCIGHVVIGFYGSYTQRDEYNIILEYADAGNLDQFLKNNDPPTDSSGIFKFWEALLDLVKALFSIHAIKPDDFGPPILRGSVLMSFFPAALTHVVQLAPGYQTREHSGCNQRGEIWSCVQARRSRL